MLDERDNSRCILMPNPQNMGSEQYCSAELSASIPTVHATPKESKSWCTLQACVGCLKNRKFTISDSYIESGIGVGVELLDRHVQTKCRNVGQGQSEAAPYVKYKGALN